MKREMGRLSFLRGFRFTLAAAALAFGCGGVLGGPTVGGESHFLAVCDGSCPDGLSCIEGICTRGCVVGEDDCGELAVGAACTDQSVEPGAVAVCDFACDDSADCGSLGATYSCENGFCRGSSIGSGTGGGASTGGASSGGASSGGASSGGASSGGTGGVPPLPGYEGASCRVAYLDYPSGSAYVPEPNGCGTCTCLDGELTCASNDCGQDGMYVSQCPPGPIKTDPFDVQRARFEGEKLVLEVEVTGGYGEGCGRHDFQLCYGPDFDASTPGKIGLTLLHDGHEDLCSAILTQSLKFNLSELSWAYRLEYDAEAGLLDTTYGLYAFGEVACEDRSRVAQSQVEQAIDFADKSCTTTEDCRVVTSNTSCARGCTTVVSATGASELEAWLPGIDETVCGDFEAACDSSGLDECTTQDVAAACVDFTCQAI